MAGPTPGEPAQWPKNDRGLADLLARTGSHLMSHPKSGWRFETTPTLAEAAALYARCRSLFSAIHLLVKALHAEDGAILSRSLFESSIRLEFLATVDNLGREALLIQRLVDGFQAFEYLFDRQKVHLGLGPGLDPDVKHGLERRRKQLLARQRRLGITRLRRFPNEDAMARRLDRQDEYFVYLYAHELTHGSALSQATRTRYPAANTVHVFAINDELEFLAGVGLFAAKAGLRSLEAATLILGWPTGETAALLQEVITLDDQMSASDV